jgi:hypothetical protein
MAAIFQRPHPLCTQPARPIHRDGEPALADVDGLVADQLPGSRRYRGDRVRALVHVRTEHDHGLRPFHSTESGHPGGHGLPNFCTRSPSRLLVGLGVTSGLEKRLRPLAS